MLCGVVEIRRVLHLHAREPVSGGGHLCFAFSEGGWVVRNLSW